MQKLLLVDPNTELCNAWQQAFAHYPEVEIINSRFEQIPNFDCIVSTANSFGLMDGGVDLAITRFFGPELQVRIQNYIIAHYTGEQPVGTSFIIETTHPRHPYVAHTPTMRVPMPIHATDNVYLAMKALLEAVTAFNALQKRIQVVACPGLGTATGRMPVEEAARQMALAYRYYLDPPQAITWSYAAARNRAVIGSTE
ncbi:macro domain-containing protein [Hymenobacter perfusus]|uniref:Phage tail protein n=1 Tax=Hymenobacter perfusus TaxID=1236770 RepID=A0A3R9NV04_9BACT|nr:macro domain-containing protein [Hymenobacter perfusus]RSK42401.1 phage tail protein [Hymenobacter perfusus]